MTNPTKEEQKERLTALLQDHHKKLGEILKNGIENNIPGFKNEVLGVMQTGNKLIKLYQVDPTE